MSEEIMSADALLTANAELRAALDVAMAENEGRIDLVQRLRTERDLLLSALHQVEAALAASRADVAQLRRAALAYVTSASYEERERLRAELHVLATVEHPGVVLLNELDAARKPETQIAHVANALTELIDIWNDAADDGDRGRDNKMLVLTLWDDGSGRIGTARGYDEDTGTFCDVSMNFQNGWNDVDGFVSFLLEWVSAQPFGERE